MQPEAWGWKTDDAGYVPIHTDQPPAPAELLKLIRCSCMSDCKNQRCSCKKHGLHCTLACVYCRENDCCNSTHLDPIIDDLDEESSVE